MCIRDSSRPVGQALDIVLRLLKSLEPLRESLSRNVEVMSGEGSILLSHRVIEDHPFHSQSLVGSKTRETGHAPPRLVSIPTCRDNRLSPEEVEAGWLSHVGNSSWQIIATKHTMSVTHVSQPPHVLPHHCCPIPQANTEAGKHSSLHS